MNEKQAVADTLSSTNAIINMLTYSVMQSNNKNLRDTFQNARNQMEALQWAIYLIAKQNASYTPAAHAGQADIAAVKQAVQNG